MVVSAGVGASEKSASGHRHQHSTPRCNTDRENTGYDVSILQLRGSASKPGVECLNCGSWCGGGCRRSRHAGRIRPVYTLVG